MEIFQTPKEVSPPREMIVKARCSVNQSYFAITFLRSAPDSWEATKAFPISKDRASRGYGSGSLVGVYIGQSYSGCPHCGNNGFFLCNACRNLNCQGSAKRENDRVYVCCANCGLSAYVSGKIEALEAHGDV